MGSERDFAEALSEALGPLYRVSVLSASGDVEASFGGLGSGRSVRSDLPLPRSSRALRVEVDVDAVEAASRVVAALVPKMSQDELPIGSFTRVDRAIDELIQMAEGQIRLPISRMSRAQKQQVVRFLDERGAFNLKKSVETVADALGVSRFTVYNYLDSSRGS
jgi:HTH domain